MNVKILKMYCQNQQTVADFKSEGSNTCFKCCCLIRIFLQTKQYYHIFVIAVNTSDGHNEATLKCIQKQFAPLNINNYILCQNNIFFCCCCCFNL